MRTRTRVQRVAGLGVLALAVSGLLVVATASPAGACSCLGPITDEDSYERADAVFVGTLVEMIPPPDREVMSSTDPVRYLFDVDEVFKGDVVEDQPVVSVRGGESCGIGISGPGPFLVFAHSESAMTDVAPGELSSWLCSGTRPLAADELPASFTGAAPEPGAAHIPAPTAPAPEGDEGTALWPGWVSLGLLTASIGAGLFLIRRRGATS